MSHLVLIPTPLEMSVVRDALLNHERFNKDAWALQICGFGPVAAAARAGALISRYKPGRVILIGIAGTFDPRIAPIGSACRFERVICDGIGVGSGDHHISASDLGWQQFSGQDAEPHIGDSITLDSSFVHGVRSVGTLLTCCSASADLPEAQQRRGRFPDAVVEDMEGFGVALACALARVPLQIVRGISNQVGDRDQTHWQVDQALSAAAKMAVRLMPKSWMPS